MLFTATGIMRFTHIKTGEAGKLILNDALVWFYEGRANAMHKVYIQEINALRERMADSGKTDISEGDYWHTHNQVNTEMINEGSGVEDVQREVHMLRSDIQAYCEQFDPIKRKYPIHTRPTA